MFNAVEYCHVWMCKQGAAAEQGSQATVFEGLHGRVWPVWLAYDPVTSQ